MSLDRQATMEVNRDIRKIKDLVEGLLEKGVIDGSTFDDIHALIPSELPLSGARGGARAANPSPAPAAAAVSPPAQAFQNLNVDNNRSNNSTSPAPPSYNDTPAPSLPARNAKPVIAQARALYRYAASDARDVSFEKDDKIAVHEYMNQDWWMGKNERTGKEGIFPRNYVFVEQENKTPAQPQYGYPSNGPPAQQNPYNSSVPPVAVSEGGGGGGGEGSGKAGEYGKKFGKKLGNAAIFGAGASIGGKIVNGIF